MLREHLQRMIEDEDVSTHLDVLRELSLKFPNTIRIVRSDHPIDRYTCVMHAFDFVERPGYLEIASMRLGRIYAGTEFVHWLLERGRIVETEEPCANDYVMYFQEDETFKHIGLYVPEDRVLSKWGIGHLYEHPIFEVPSSYGTISRYYRSQDPESMYFYFTEFAEENGVIFD